MKTLGFLLIGLLQLWGSGNPCANSIDDKCNIKVAFDYAAEDLRVKFTNFSEGEYDQIVWNFGDGTSSLEENPIHEYNKTGSYLFCLQVSNKCIEKCEDKFCAQVYVFNPCE